MPEYLAPGVFVEETSFRQKTIEGVSTSTTGFVGPCRSGPVFGEPPLITSYSEFERIYGGMDRLRFGDLQANTHNYMAHAVRAYFEEGGKRLYIARAYNPLQDPYPPTQTAPAQLSAGNWSDGHARWQSEDSPPAEFGLRARFPGAAGNMTVNFTFKRGENMLQSEDGEAVLRGAQQYDVVWALENTSPPGNGQIYWVERFFDGQRNTFRLRQNDPEQSASSALALASMSEVRKLTVTVNIVHPGQFSDDQTFDDLTFHPTRAQSLARYFAAEAESRSAELERPLIFASNLLNGASIANALLQMPNVASGSAIINHLGDSSARARQATLELEGGNDGNQPTPADYQGRDNDGVKNALKMFEDLEDISIVAAPGSTFNYSSVGGADHSAATTGYLIAHCERMRYRVAVLDSTNSMALSEVRAQRAAVDSKLAAYYYPWIRIYDPVTETEIFNPPSGHMAGIFARNDTTRGVHKAPANEVIRMALGYEILINKAQQEALNPEGINCLRFFEGRGYRVWGARTTTSDPEWKYLNVRRYFAFLERSIEKGTQWAVFENNGDVLWLNVRRTIEDFLFNEWKEKHLFGTKPEEAYFVRCDRTTMSQNDLDNGRLVCLIGVAPLRPAEFVIFRIGQKTADSRG